MVTQRNMSTGSVSGLPRGDRDYRADVDQAGQWCVWQRLGAGWAIWCTCRSRADAIERAAELNRALPAGETPVDPELGVA